MVSRRRTGRRSGRGPRRENNSYWMSYSDMMAALLLMFVLLLFLSFNRYMAFQEAKEAELAEKEGQLAQQEAQLTEAQEALLRREEELTTIRAVLNTQQVELGEKQLALDEKTAALDTSKDELEQSLAQLILQQKQIEEQEALLALSEQEIAEAREKLSAATKDLEEREVLISAKDLELLAQKELLDDQTAQLDEQAARIDELVGVRSRIIEQLRDAFAVEGLNVKVDRNTGAITMDSTVFFDTDSAVMKTEGYAFLARVLPVYFRTLMSTENAEFVGEIIVEGHTDSDGSYEHNLDLSQRRAQAVVNYCMGDQFTVLTETEKELLRTMITANGRSESQLIYDAYGIEDKAASRRVEIKFRLQDAEMIESLNRILNEMDVGE